MEAIKLIAADLQEGENRYATCPSCGRRGKLSVLREQGRAVYHCFRAGCDLNRGGSLPMSGGGNLVRTRSAPQRTVPTYGTLSAPCKHWQRWLLQTLGFNREHLVRSGVKIESSGRVAYPILSPYGEERGLVLRNYNGGVPKALTVLPQDTPKCSWYRPQGSEPTSHEVWLVEDQPSAVRASMYVPAVALLGVTPSAEVVRELMEHTTRVVWALDADATALALINRQRWALNFEESRVVILPCDLKDMAEDDLAAFIGGNTYDQRD